MKSSRAHLFGIAAIINSNKSLLLLLVAAVLIWLTAWGPCAAPWHTTCFTNGLWGDYKHHYQGWISYLHNREWIPPTTLAFTWPSVSSTMFTDSMPLIAILAKPFSRFFNLPDWQYFSLASLLNSLAIVWCTVQISRARLWSSFTTILAGILLMTSSISWSRLQVGHESLQLHALLLIAMTFNITGMSKFRAWCALCAVSTGIHPYYLPMVLPAACLQIYQHSDRRRSIAKLFLLVLVIGATAFACGFAPGSAVSGSEVWGANGLALIDPQHHSLIFPGLKKREPFDIEGYAYLGAGVAIGVLLSLANPSESGNRKPLFSRSWWILAISLFILAMGPTWALGQTPVTPGNFLCKIPGVCLTYDIFRSSGRFTWPLSYSILLWLVDYLAYTKRHPLLFIVSFLQIADSNANVLFRQNADYVRRRFAESSPAIQWLDSHLEVKTALKQSNLFLVGHVSDPKKLPPGFAPQYANPSIMSNWGGEGMTRIPKNTLGFKALSYWLEQTKLRKSYPSDTLQSHRNVLLLTDHPIELRQISLLASQGYFTITHLSQDYYLLSLKHTK